MMRDAYAMGADEAVILSDRKFAGADVLSTSFTRARGSRCWGSGSDHMRKADYDGDTAQVGPAIAEHMHIPHAAWVGQVVDVDEKRSV